MEQRGQVPPDGGGRSAGAHEPTGGSGGVPARTLAIGGAAVGAVVAALLVVFLLFGNVLADLGDEEPVAVQQEREGRLSQAAYESVELGRTKEDVLAELRPVLPVGSRVLDRHEGRDPETVAGECVYFDRGDGRAGQQFRFCFADDVLVEKTVVLAGDPGEGSAVVEGQP